MRAVRAVVVVGVLGLTMVPGSAGDLPSPGLVPVPAPNIVLILTDDQRWDTLWAMPTVQSELVARGMSFADAFVVNSLCCPSRASILTGQYSHSTGIYANQGSHGGFGSFDDASTIATSLHADGYHTGLFGKYLNGYVDESASYIPPGWDRWFAFISKEGNGGYFDYSVTDQGTPRSYGSADADYSTDVLAGQADAFIRSTGATQPLFLYFAVHAPHERAIPAPRHQEAFSDLEPWRPPSYNERDVSDKPAYVQAVPRWDKAKRAQKDLVRINQYRTLLAVDDAVGTILNALTDTGRLTDTVVVFASDNGYLWGEHRWSEKTVPYEEATRVPLVVRYDRLTSTASTDTHLVVNIDLAPTFADLAGASLGEADGASLVPLLNGNGEAWRTDFLIEHLKTWDVVPTYCAVRNQGFAFYAYGTGELELYDLSADPYELVNVARDPGYQQVLEGLTARLEVLCDPPPPKYTPP